MIDKTAEELKALGNEAFVAKDFPVAIEHYSAAITKDPTNHVFFSNRSASYAGLQQWEKAVEDAKECIRLNPTFMKGYYRLATAQQELKEYDAAESTIKQGLTIEANNSQLLKVLRQIKAAKKAVLQAASTSTTTTTPGQDGNNRSKIDAAASKELYDLQLLHSQTTREYQIVQANLSKSQREQRVSQITLEELEGGSTKAGTTAAVDAKGYYKSIGKIFMKSTKENVVHQLQSKIEDQSKQETELGQKMEYLEKRLKSQQQNMEELIGGGGD